MLHVASCFSRAYFFFLLIPRPPISTSTDTLFPYSTLFRSGAAPVERLEDGLEGGIARIAAVMVRQQPDSLGAERIAGVVDLGEAGLDIGQRQAGEIPEPAGKADAHLGRILVAVAREPRRLVRVAEPQPGRGDRRHRRLDAEIGRAHV